MLYALVIGAGIHGLTFAIELAKRGVKVTILEKQTNFLLGASSGTHNRAHLGYHYPRSLVTAKECLDGYRYFIENYPQALYCPLNLVNYHASDGIHIQHKVVRRIL